MKPLTTEQKNHLCQNLKCTAAELAVAVFNLQTDHGEFDVEALIKLSDGGQLFIRNNRFQARRTAVSVNDLPEATPDDLKAAAEKLRSVGRPEWIMIVPGRKQEDRERDRAKIESITQTGLREAADYIRKEYPAVADLLDSGSDWWLEGVLL